MVGAVLLRLVPGPWNFKPVGALSLFSGGRMPLGQALLVPLLVMLASDSLLHVIRFAPMGYSAFAWVTPFVYASFLISVLLGRWLCRKDSVVRIGTASLLCSAQFFLVTNFGFWLMGDGVIYSHDPAGLLTCYVAGLPFLGWTVTSDLFFSALLFGSYAWATHRSAVLKARLAS
jgi:hypothetical protein